VPVARYSRDPRPSRFAAAHDVATRRRQGNEMNPFDPTPAAMAALERAVAEIRVKSFVGNFAECWLHTCETLRPLGSLRRLRDMPSPRCHSSRSQTARRSPLASDRIALWLDTWEDYAPGRTTVSPPKLLQFSPMKSCFSGLKASFLLSDWPL
jgi:hypothetical protein